MVENSLCPVLGNYVAGEPRSVVVLDNVEMHHRPEVVDAIEGAGALAIYLPRYSPDYSPIELGFAHTKQELRKQSLRAPASDIEFQDRQQCICDLVGFFRIALSIHQNNRSHISFWFRLNHRSLFLVFLIALLIVCI